MKLVGEKLSPGDLVYVVASGEASKSEDSAFEHYIAARVISAGVDLVVKILYRHADLKPITYPRYRSSLHPQSLGGSTVLVGPIHRHNVRQAVYDLMAFRPIEGMRGVDLRDVLNATFRLRRFALRIERLATSALRERDPKFRNCVDLELVKMREAEKGLYQAYISKNLLEEKNPGVLTALGLTDIEEEYWGSYAWKVEGGDAPLPTPRKRKGRK